MPAARADQPGLPEQTSIDLSTPEPQPEATEVAWWESTQHTESTDTTEERASAGESDPDAADRSQARKTAMQEFLLPVEGTVRRRNAALRETEGWDASRHGDDSINVTEAPTERKLETAIDEEPELASLQEPAIEPTDSGATKPETAAATSEADRDSASEPEPERVFNQSASVEDASDELDLTSLSEPVITPTDTGATKPTGAIATSDSGNTQAEGPVESPRQVSSTEAAPARWERLPAPKIVTASAEQESAPSIELTSAAEAPSLESDVESQKPEDAETPASDSPVEEAEATQPGHTDAKAPPFVGFEMEDIDHVAVFRGTDGVWLYLPDSVRDNVHMPIQDAAGR